MDKYFYYNYGYDGSGLPMHVEVVVLDRFDDRALVRFPEHVQVPALDRFTETQTVNPRERIVPAAAVYERPGMAPIASWNWND